MEEKKEVKITLSTIIVIIFIMVLLVITSVLAIRNNILKSERLANQETQIKELQDQVTVLKNSLNEKADKKDIKKEEKDNKASNIIQNKEMSFAIVSVERTPSTEEFAYNSKFVDSKENLKELKDLINSLVAYQEKSFIADFGDMPPMMTIYFENGKPLHLMAMDGYVDEGEEVNLICLYYDVNGSDKTLYKIDSKFADYLEKLFEKTNSNKISEGKEIYGLTSLSNISNEEEKIYNNQFLVIENDTLYFSNDLKDKIYESECKILNDNTIEINPKKETQDYAFYTASKFEKKNVDDCDYIEIVNGDRSITYQKIK